MKAMMKSVLATAALLLCTMQFSNAQTYQGEFNATWDEPVYAFCLDEYLTGSFTYHVTYHVNKKTGYIDRVHWNVKNSKLVGVDSGKEYRIIDTGANDSFRNLWDFWAAVGIYSPDLLPPSNPQEGTLINSQFKWMSKGIVYKGSIKIQIHTNAAGEVKAEVVKYDFCF